MTLDTPPRIEIEARIVEYMPNAMTDHFADNRFAVFDAAILTLSKPIDLAGRRLTIYLPHPTSNDTLWRRVGSRIAFDVAAPLLAPGTIVFGPAVHDLRLLEDPHDVDRGTP